jgi:ribosomal protein S18 acetylase RimI-like enzyme
MLPVHIRPLAPTDQTAARALILEGLREHWGWLDPRLNPDLEDIAASYLTPGHVFLVAESGQTLAGTGALVIDGDSGQIVRVAVHPQWRRRGVGRALVIALLDAARARGLTRVWMETNDDWLDAIGLYRRCGFQEFDQREGCVFMALNLAGNPNASGA